MKKPRAIVVMGILSSLVFLGAILVMMGYPYYQRIMKDDTTNVMAVADCERIAQVYNAKPAGDGKWKADLLRHCRFLGREEGGRYAIFLLPPGRIDADTDVVGCTDQLGGDEPGFVMLRVLGDRVQATFQPAAEGSQQVIAMLKRQGAQEFVAQ